MSPEEVNRFLKQSFEGFVSESPSNAKWEILRHDLLSWIQGLPPDEAFAGLTYAIENEDRYQVQWLAGDLLLRAEIPCSLPVEEWLDRINTKLNASASPVVRYGSAVFGQKALADAVKAALAEERAQGARKSSLETIVYWLNQG